MKRNKSDIIYFPNGKIKVKTICDDFGKFHSLTEPAIQIFNENGFKVSEEWYVGGNTEHPNKKSPNTVLYHASKNELKYIEYWNNMMDDKPSIIEYDDKGNKTREFYTRFIDQKGADGIVIRYYEYYRVNNKPNWIEYDRNGIVSALITIKGLVSEVDISNCEKTYSEIPKEEPKKIISPQKEEVISSKKEEIKSETNKGFFKKESKSWFSS